MLSWMLLFVMVGSSAFFSYVVGTFNPFLGVVCFVLLMALITSRGMPDEE